MHFFENMMCSECRKWMRETCTMHGMKCHVCIRKELAKVMTEWEEGNIKKS